MTCCLIISVTGSGYFADGQGICEAVRFHREKLEVSECTEADLADASKNPKYRTVQHWYTVWRDRHQGPRTGQGMITVIKIMRNMINMRKLFTGRTLVNQNKPSCAH